MSVGCQGGDKQPLQLELVGQMSLSTEGGIGFLSVMERSMLSSALRETFAGPVGLADGLQNWIYEGYE